MFRKLTLAAVMSVFAVTTANAQDGQQWKLGVAMTALGGGDRGVMINQVFAGSPAAEIDLQPGDVLLTINGTLAADPLGVRDTIFANDRVSLVIRRGAQYYQKDVSFAPPPAPEPEPAPQQVITSQVVGSPRGVVASPGRGGAGAPKMVVGAAAPKKIQTVTTKQIAPPKNVGPVKPQQQPSRPPVRK